MIDLILDNPIIIGFVVYFVWMMLKPSKAEKKNTPQRPVSTPTYQEADTNTNPPHYRVEPKKEERVEKRALTTSSDEHESRKKVTLTQSNSSDATGFDYAKEKQRLEERKKKAEEAMKKLNSVASASAGATHTSSRLTSVCTRSVKPNKQQLREGVLWAEILSKPRAKRQSYK